MARHRQGWAGCGHRSAEQWEGVMEEEEEEEEGGGRLLGRGSAS